MSFLSIAITSPADEAGESVRHAEADDGEENIFEDGVEGEFDG